MESKRSNRTKHYILFFKPFGVLSQFTSESGNPGLSAYGPFPPDVYVAGRLDVDSEGLLLLTNDNRVNHRLTLPRFAHQRTYLVQVEGVPTREALHRLQTGVTIKGYRTKPSLVRLLDSEPDLPPRPVPVRTRKSIPTTWLEVILTEGRNRQVRRMTAAVGYPTLRLVRTKIGSLTLRSLSPGEQRSLTGSELRGLLNDLALS
ncbi:MAG: pseudouridine synthase [Ignavibacteria bacterium]|nr:pseudouridine synthase [Ignavibacteria bacterium]